MLLVLVLEDDVLGLEVAVDNLVLVAVLDGAGLQSAEGPAGRISVESGPGVGGA